MKPIHILQRNLPHTEGIAEALAAHPELWNQHTLRTASSQSPHREVDDIWVRYSPTYPVEPSTPYYPEWYPACDVLPIRRLARDIMVAVDGEFLGSILITRIPPGKQVYPHRDTDWHAGFYSKYALQLKGNLQQSFCYEGVEFKSETGDLYWFRNDLDHWVINNSDEERITLIVCVKSEKG